uniref:Translin n=1 Tax=Spongospora subterranea TaxID=70186 RepID=A0A0H5QLY7_9EUKA|eukprot:CRZ02356.1 hypothetical protein [Spongospora subterranea]
MACDIQIILRSGRCLILLVVCDQSPVTMMEEQQDLHSLMTIYDAELLAIEQRREAVVASVKKLVNIQHKTAGLILSAHQISNTEDIADLCRRVMKLLLSLGDIWAEIHQESEGHWEMFRYLWRSHIYELVGTAAFAHYLVNKSLASKSQIEVMLAIRDGPFQQIDLEEYLIGVSSLPNELARLCTNLVTSGHATFPSAIGAFVAELYGAFRMLNLRNDILRRRVDGIKYDLQKIESIIYDVAIRKLQNSS